MAASGPRRSPCLRNPRRTSRPICNADRPAIAVSSPCAPGCGRGRSSGRCGPRPEPGPRSACLPDRGSKGRQGFGGRFFESLHEARVLARGLGRVLRASGEARKAGRCRQPGESPLVRDNTAPVFDPPLQVKSSPADPPPSCSSVMLKAGAGFDDLSKFSHRGRGTQRSNSPSGPASLNRCRRSACSRLTVFARCPAG